jgi:hypothetical protein
MSRITHSPALWAASTKARSSSSALAAEVAKRGFGA